MTKIFKKVLFLLLVFLFLNPIITNAIDFPGEPGGGELNIGNFLNKILDITWWIFIVIVIILFIIIAILFLNSHGDPEELKKARRALIWALAGVLIGILAFSIIRVVAFAVFGLNLAN